MAADRSAAAVVAGPVPARLLHRVRALVEWALAPGDLRLAMGSRRRAPSTAHQADRQGAVQCHPPDAPVRSRCRAGCSSPAVAAVEVAALVASVAVWRHRRQGCRSTADPHSRRVRRRFLDAPRGPQHSGPRPDPPAREARSRPSGRPRRGWPSPSSEHARAPRVAALTGTRTSSAEGTHSRRSSVTFPA